MFKYISLILTVSLSTSHIQTAEVEMQVEVARQAVAPVTTDQLCQRIIEVIPPIEFPQALIPAFRIKSWEEAATAPAKKARITASLYCSRVENLKSINPVEDMNQAKTWYAQAALLGDTYALYRLAIILIKWEKQEALGLIFMQAAADRNDYDARVYLGLERQEF